MADCTLTVEQSRSEWATIHDTNQWRFQIAQGVDLRPGESTVFNVYWQSKDTGSDFGVGWKPVYGLNWCTSIPTEGSKLELKNPDNWKQFTSGQVFDLKADGLFHLNSTQQSDFGVKINVLHTGPVHIVLGIRSWKEPSFDPIFVDPCQLGTGAKAQYNPVNKVKWWYETGLKSSTVIGDPKSNSASVSYIQDYSSYNNEGNYSYTATINLMEGVWTVNPSH